MGFSHSFALLLVAAVAVCNVDALHLLAHKHEDIKMARRQVGPPIQPSSTPASAMSASATSISVLTYITPSPGASPVAVTEQSQLITSYVPQFTLCELPPQAVFPATPVPVSSGSTAPWRNYSISIPSGLGTCTTIYSATQTMVCDTTLTGLVQKYTVTNCAQDITFSTEYGYVLASPTASSAMNTSGVALVNGTAPASTITPVPTIQRLTTYYIAPWEAVTAGTAPNEVALKVCATYANGTQECIRQYEVWHTSLVTDIATSTTSVNISTTIHGNSQVIVETFVANVTAQVTTFRMSTDMELEYKTEIITTERESVTPTTAPTSYVTVTVEPATASATGDRTTTRTSTVRRTSYTTVYVGTTTEPLPTDAAAATAATEAEAEEGTALSLPSKSVDWVSLLGIATAKVKR